MTQRCLRGILPLVTGVVLAIPAMGETSRLDAPSEPLLSNTQPEGWSAGVHYVSESRELKRSGDVLELDAGRVVAELGYEVAPFLQFAAQVGSTKAELDAGDGENGLAWAAIARLNLAEYVLHESPVVGRTEWLGAAVEAQYRFSESNQGDATLEWGETQLVPSVYYFRNRQADVLRQEYEASGLGLRGGLVLSTIDGELNSVDLEENRNFGFMLGADARIGSGWVVRARANIFGSGDQSFEIGTLFHF